VAEYTANLIAQSLYAQVDDHGNEFILMKEIVDHKSDASAVKKDDGWVEGRGNRSRRQTTRGWQLLVQWKDGTATWVKIAEEPAFAWWIHDVLRRRDRIVAKFKS
jgi:hypothetical protein